MFPTLIHIGTFSLGRHVFGPFYIATYGFFVALGYLTAILWLKSQIGHMKLTEERFWTLVYCLFFGALAGGKLLFIILNWNAFAAGRMNLLRDFRFGFVFFGGFMGVVGMGFLYFRKNLSEAARVGDYFGAILPVGHAIGRLGCLAAGCCYGRPTTMPWAIRFTNPDSLITTGLLDVPVHPTQLYEAAGNIAIAGVLFRLLKRVQKDELQPGSVLCAYVLLYAVLRFIVEFYRGDDRGGFWLGLSPSQWIALGLATADLIVIRRRGWQKKSA